MTMAKRKLRYGVSGMAFLETAVKSAASNVKWVKFPAI
jgi:hypothetical protein